MRQNQSVGLNCSTFNYFSNRQKRANSIYVIVAYVVSCVGQQRFFNKGCQYFMRLLYTINIIIHYTEVKYYTHDNKFHISR